MRSHAKAASVLVSAAMLLLGIVASAASAAPSATTAWVYQSTFGAGDIANAGSYPGTGLALEGGSGNILVTNPAGQVNVYAPDAVLGGTPLTTFPAPNPFNIAVDRSTGAVYANAQVPDTEFQRYLTDGAPIPTYTLDPDFAPTSALSNCSAANCSLAIDPSTHDVLALGLGLGAAQEIQRFDSETGELISRFTVHLVASGGLTVGLDGTIYVAGSLPGPNNGRIARFTPGGTQLPAFSTTGLIDGGGRLALNPATGDLLVAGAGRLLSFSPNGEKVFDVPAQPSDVGGMAVDPDRERLYIRHMNGTETAGIDTYIPAPYAGVDIPTASEITTTGFHVSTEVDPGEKEGGGLPDGSTMHFEYTLAGESGWSSTPDQPVSAAGEFGADITGLSPTFTYEVRAVASNSLTTHVTDATKVTTAGVPPEAETGSATDVTETSAVLNGSINPAGLQTTYYFEYGTNTSYGSRIPVGIEGVAGGGRDPKLFSRTITGLTAGTTYHFHLVATNSAGTAEGDDHTFTTVAAGAIPTRAYEQVTPPDKNGASITARLGMQVSPDGSGISYTSKAGSEASPIITRSLATRGSADWSGKIDTDPPLLVGSTNFQVHTTLAVSNDFGHAFVVSNKALVPGGIDQGANLYKVDLATDTFHLIGTSDATAAFESFAGSTTSGRFQAGAPDFSWIVFTSRPPLLPGAPVDAIYRWSEADGLEVVSLLPNGDMSAGMRSTGSVYHTVSTDGSRIYYSAAKGAEEGVFLREDGGAPVPVSVSHVPGDPATPRPAVLLGVNSDGRYAFLTSAIKLTSDALGESGDLYRYDASDGSIEFLGVQASTEIAADGIQIVRGGFGVGSDGNTFYFNAKGELGAQVFSAWHGGAVHTAFPEPADTYIEDMSPNGRYFAKARTVEGVEKVIQLYDAETNQTTCVTCLADGTPVSGGLQPGGSGDNLISNQITQTVLNDGTVFFETGARLLAADVNGAVDVYEFENGTLRLITPGNRSFDAAYGGVSEDGSSVFFTTAQKLVGRDNDENVDIYVARVNGGLPVQNPPPPQECLRDDCKATPNAGPELPFGGSEALSGPENVKPKTQKKCGKGKRTVKVKGKVKCVKKHKANKSKKGGNR